jgi:P4 family phage/plasmid primase-like protien
MGDSDDQDQPVRTFRHLLESYSVADSSSSGGVVVTHTSLTGGKYHVPGCEYAKFLDAYCQAIEDGEHWSLVERPTEHYPLLVDLDFVFAPPPGGERPARQHDSDFVHGVVRAYAQTLRKFLATEATRGRERPQDTVVETLVCHVLQREEPYETDGRVKDGLHLVFSNTALCSDVQRIVRDRALPLLRPLIEGLAGQKKAVEDVVDDCTFSKPRLGRADTPANNWMMHGSRKPGRAPYLETEVVYVSSDGSLDVRESDSDVFDVVSRLALRKTRSVTALSRDARAELAEITRRRNDDAREQLLRDGRAASMLQVGRNDMKNRSEDVELARRLVKLLSPARAAAYDSWIRVGWCLRNIDDDLLRDWDDFSKQSHKYQGGECALLWPHVQKADGMKMGTLRRWAGEDSPAEYAKIRSEGMSALVMSAFASGMAHFDVAKVVQEMYKAQYVCVAAGGEGCWFHFAGHRWHPSNKAVDLRTHLSVEVFSEFMSNARKLLTDSKESSEKQTKYFKYCDQLKVSGFKGAVMRETSDLFYDAEFQSRLDSREHLLGFENGVYDLDKGEFRAGLPSDNVSMTTRHDYVDVPDDAPEMEELRNFFAQVFPSAAKRAYFLSRMAEYLSGKIRQEEFLILTGSGSNGKSKTIELLQSAIGDYAASLPTALMTQKRGASNAASPEVAKLKGRRVAVMQEPSDTDKINISIMKEFSGGDIIQARSLYGEPFEFRPQFSMIMTCNTLPGIPDIDGGTWRRIKVVEFDSKFTAKPDPDDPTHFPIDYHLNDKFPRWRPAFVCMLLRLHAKHKARPVEVPAEVEAAVATYLAEQDFFSQYTKEVLDKKEGARIEQYDLVQSFREYAKKHGFCNLQRIAPSALAKKMPQLGKLRELRGKMVWEGWAFKQGDDEYAA